MWHVRRLPWWKISWLNAGRTLLIQCDLPLLRANSCPAPRDTRAVSLPEMKWSQPLTSHMQTFSSFGYFGRVFYSRSPHNAVAHFRCSVTCGYVVPPKQFLHQWWQWPRRTPTLLWCTPSSIRLSRYWLSLQVPKLHFFFKSFLSVFQSLLISSVNFKLLYKHDQFF